MKNTYNENVYKEIGQFVVLFEQICGNIRLAIRDICFLDKTLMSMNFAEILLSGLTAEPLNSKLLAVFIERFEDRNDEFEILKQLKFNFDKLISIRNNIVHGLTHIDTFEDSDKVYGKIFLSHPKLNKYGLDKNTKFFNLKEFQVLNKNIKDLEECFSLFIIFCSSKKFYLKNRIKLIDHISNKLLTIKIEFTPETKCIQEHKHRLI